MKIDIHFLQNFAPSNLNRDDTGAPKDCEFGGVRRARISSQCWKRAIREAFSTHDLFGDQAPVLLAARTKRLVDVSMQHLVEAGKSQEDSLRVLTFALQSAKLKVDDERKTQYLLFLPKRTAKALAKTALAHWDTLLAASGQAEPADEGAKKKTKSAEKKAAKDAVPKDVAKEIEAVLEDATRTPDLALFGRMIADNPDWNVDAACQVAHALSTNRVSVEFDFYTAVDDFRPKENTGSDMMGTVAFQSSCFYRYATLDVEALHRNLGGAAKGETDALAKRTIEAFLRASALAIPTGKQNGMAAQNRPSYMLAVIRKSGTPQSLANAFVRPARPQGEASLIETSTVELEKYLDKSLSMWGDDAQAFACADIDARASERPKRVATFDAWVKDVVGAAGAAP
jgi:CRISPR system Cascade subunit CasC